MKRNILNKRGIFYKFISMFLVVTALITVFGVPTVSAKDGEIQSDNINDDKVNPSLLDTYDYFEQYPNLSNINKSSTEIELGYEDCNKFENTEYVTKEIDGQSGIVLDANNGWVEWEFEVNESGTVSAQIIYAPITDKATDIMVEIAIDGKTPFTESKSLYLPRLWRRDNSSTESERPFSKDAQGNEIAPDQIQVSQWNKSFVNDAQGFYDEPYLFYFEEGRHTLRLSAVDSAIVLGGIKLYNETEISYKEYFNKYSSKTVKKGKITYQQAELTELVNNVSINPTYDKLNTATVPSDPTYIMLNTIGARNWSAQGDSISWKVNVPHAGMYRVSFRARQNSNPGLISYRNLYINGNIPYTEARNIPFSYSTDWQIFTLGGKSEQLLYLEPGDILTLSCAAGKTTEILRNIRRSINQLNTLYRKVIAITSVTPDTFQDYKIEKKIADIDKQLADITSQLRSTHDKLSKILGTKGSLASSLNYVAQITEELSEKPYIIPERLSAFKNAIETLGSLIASLSQQPLEIDYIAYMPDNGESLKANAGFFANLKFNTLQFLSSFLKDYSVKGGKDGERTINVWVSTGRDQAQILNNSIMADFTTKTGIGVVLNMVDTGTTLVRASLAGKGPDVALMIPQTTPVELAARGALVDLKNLVDEDMYNDFHESAWTSFYYNDGLYAIPETQGYQLLFYRTDIFEELGLTVPDTWEEFYKVMAVIQNNNLAVGMPEIDTNNMGVSASLSVFSSLIMQRGLKNYYNEDLSKTMFDTEIAYEAFTEWSDLYTDYGLDRQMDFYSRFRSGEVPMAIRGFSDAVQIQQAAPEIRGLWAMAPYPGTKKEDGTIDRAQVSGVTGSVMLKAAEERGLKDEAFSFMKWWVSSEVQYEYGRDLETALGVVGRYYTANLEAFSKSNWSTSDMQLIKSQLKFIRNQPTVPGSYAVQRDLTSALREVISGENRPRRALMIYNTDINEEIARKRKEFGLGS